MATAEFANALDGVLAEASHRRTAVMCAESLWWRCHRRLIADAAVAAGAEVVHLLDVNKSQPHPERLV